MSTCCVAIVVVVVVVVVVVIVLGLDLIQPWQITSRRWKVKSWLGKWLLEQLLMYSLKSSFRMSEHDHNNNILSK